MNNKYEFKDLKWLSPFYLNQPISSDSDKLKLQGVYLWVYENNSYKKIVYVGSAWSQKGFIKRIKEEISDMLTGNAFMFKIKENENPYDLLIKTDKELSKNFYYPKRGDIEKDFNWVKTYAYNYLSKLKYWICPLPQTGKVNMKELCQYLETQIQAVLKNKYGIKYVKDKPNLSWAGKLDKLYDEKLSDFYFEFESFPDIDDKSIFKNLNQETRVAIEKIKLR